MIITDGWETIQWSYDRSKVGVSSIFGASLVSSATLEKEPPAAFTEGEWEKRFSHLRALFMSGRKISIFNSCKCFCLLRLCNHFFLTKLWLIRVVTGRLSLTCKKYFSFQSWLVIFFVMELTDLNPDFLPLKSRDVRVPKNRRLARIPTPEIGKVLSFSTTWPIPQPVNRTSFWSQLP